MSDDPSCACQSAASSVVNASASARDESSRLSLMGVLRILSRSAASEPFGDFAGGREPHALSRLHAAEGIFQMADAKGMPDQPRMKVENQHAAGMFAVLQQAVNA